MSYMLTEITIKCNFCSDKKVTDICPIYSSNVICYFSDYIKCSKNSTNILEIERSLWYQIIFRFSSS